jgi:hypothetical protein
MGGNSVKVQGILMDWQNRRDKLLGKVHFVQQLQMELPTESQEAATATRYRQ